ncbi:hypothetical protein HID58_086785, partial [Brassica napus]
IKVPTQIDAADNGDLGYWSSVGGTNWFPNPTHEMRQRLREHTKPTVGATKQGKWSPGGVITPRKQATQIGKGELHLNVGDAFTTGCPQNPSKTASGARRRSQSITNERHEKRFSVELLTSIFHSIKRGEALQQPWNYTEEETFWKAVTAATCRAFRRDSDLGSDPDPIAIGLTKLTSTNQTSFMLQRDQRCLWFHFVSTEKPIEPRHTNKERQEEEAKG